jgi:urea transporter
MNSTQKPAYRRQACLPQAGNMVLSTLYFVLGTWYLVQVSTQLTVDHLQPTLLLLPFQQLLETHIFPIPTFR